MSDKYRIWAKFDVEGEPPGVFICDASTALGTTIIEVFEEPTCAHPSGWSWDAEDWTEGPLAKRVVGLLNGDKGAQ